MKKNDIVMADGSYFVVTNVHKEYFLATAISNGIIKPSCTRRFPKDDDSVKVLNSYAMHLNIENIRKAMRPYIINVILKLKENKTTEYLLNHKEIEVLKLYNTNVGITVYVCDFKVRVTEVKKLEFEKILEETRVCLTCIKKCQT